jgi:NAD-dependent dihydropyrimidine dehydrogenase PreA subunit
MTYLVTENRIKCKYMDCVEVCPDDAVFADSDPAVTSSGSIVKPNSSSSQPLSCWAFGFGWPGLVQGRRGVEVGLTDEHERGMMRMLVNMLLFSAIAVVVFLTFWRIVVRG